MESPNRRELQVALQIVQAHPQATGAALDEKIKEALQLKTAVVARIWRIQAQQALNQQLEAQDGI